MTTTSRAGSSGSSAEARLPGRRSTHALGTTTIPSKPTRVVVVGYTDQEPLLAMGVRPVGAMDWFGQGTFGKWPWEREAWGDEPPVVVSSKSYEIDFEKVAAQRPDLILGLYAELKRGDYDKLSKIAPTVAQAKGDAYTTPWRDMTRVAAKAVGRVEEGEKLIEQTEARFAAFRKAHPETAEQTALVVDAGTAPKSYYPFSSKDPRGQFLRELGYKPSAKIDKLAGDELRHGGRQGARRPARRRPAVPPDRRARAQEARRRRAVQPARRRARAAGHRPAVLQLAPSSARPSRSTRC